MLTKKPPVGTTSTQKDKHSVPQSATTPAGSATKKPTRITVKYNCGFGNTLFLRGEGAGLSWEKGIQLKNVDADTWIWELDRPFTQCTFKILINDEQYEIGGNHVLNYGENTTLTPDF